MKLLLKKIDISRRNEPAMIDNSKQIQNYRPVILPG
jgi:hypothetical protein